jgi:hypothetical protein
VCGYKWTDYTIGLGEIGVLDSAGAIYGRRKVRGGWGLERLLEIGKYFGLCGGGRWQFKRETFVMQDNSKSAICLTGFLERVMLKDWPVCCGEDRGEEIGDGSSKRGRRGKAH